VAVYELAWLPDTPSVVVLDEAIEVGKKYGSEQSGSFINGILDAVRKRVERGEVPTTRTHGDRP
jgi:N utilization substance protein B